jgi:hypothetical protein
MPITYPTVEVYGDLPLGLGPEDAGSSYIVKRDSLLYVWNGLDWPYNGSGQVLAADLRKELEMSDQPDEAPVPDADTVVNDESGQNDNPAADAPADEESKPE